LISIGHRLALMPGVIRRARREKRSPVSGGILGLTGRAETDIGPDGAVFVRGELWLATSRESVASGEAIRVIDLHGISLEVEAVSRDASTPGDHHVPLA
jgi:membrane-bound serine protease (ClpP class)